MLNNGLHTKKMWLFQSKYILFLIEVSTAEVNELNYAYNYNTVIFNSVKFYLYSGFNNGFCNKAALHKSRYRLKCIPNKQVRCDSKKIKILILHEKETLRGNILFWVTLK